MPRRSRTMIASVAALGGLAIVVPTLSGGGADAGAANRTHIPTPLIYARGFPDPSVVESRVGLVGAATARDINIARSPADVGPWSVLATPALARRPSWATSAHIWAPDIQRAPGGWLMYFAAELSGADPNTRCIGVAAAHTAFGPFTPVGNTPLVCPVVPGVQALGVIDPSSFKGNHGQRYLVYRVQGQPSSIRLVKLSRGGKRVQLNQQSRLLTSNPGIEENPVIVRRGSKWVMLTSAGWFGHCAYRTYWRRSPDFTDWSRSTPKLLLSSSSGLCGPGGADVVQRRDGVTQLYFHAWTCDGSPYPCPADWNKDRPQGRKGVRALYGANLRWTAYARPVVDSWIGPTLPDPTPTPTSTPTPTPTVS